MRTAIIASLAVLSLSTAAQAATITADRALSAYEAGKAGDGPQNGFQYASCAGYWAGWSKHTMENVTDPLVAALPEAMKAAAAQKNQLYWHARAKAEVQAENLYPTQAQGKLNWAQSIVRINLAEGTETAISEVFTQLGRCHVEW